MKICFVSYDYPPHIIGGTGVYAFHLTKELAGRGHKVHVIAPNIERKETNTIEDGVFVTRIPIINKPFLSLPSFWFGLSKKSKELNKSQDGFDIYHDNDVIGGIGITRPRLKGQRVVTIHHLQSTTARHLTARQSLFSFRLEAGFPYLILEKETIQHVDKIVAVSNFTKKDLIQSYKVPLSKVESVYNGVCPDDFAFPIEEIQKTKNILGLKDQTVFLFVGRINDPRKGLFVLLKAWSILLKDLKNHVSVKLLVIGSGDQAKAKQLVNSLGLTKSIIFKGYVSGALLNQIYCASDIFVSPSLLEGFGLTLVEAMAAGKPVITFNSGAISEIVKDNLNGRVLNQQDPHSLAEAMNFFIENPTLTRQIGDYNREYVSNKFSWKNTALMTERLYEKLLLDQALK